MSMTNLDIVDCTTTRHLCCHLILFSCGSMADPDVAARATPSQLLDMVDWPPPPPRWQNDAVDDDVDETPETVVVSESKAESEFDGLALQRLIDSISTPTPADIIQSLPDEPKQTTDQPRPVDDVDADSLLDGGSGSPDDSLQQTASSCVEPPSVCCSQPTESGTLPTVTSAATRHVTVTSSAADACRSRQALTVSVISADSGCSSQSSGTSSNLTGVLMNVATLFFLK